MSYFVETIRLWPFRALSPCHLTNEWRRPKDWEKKLNQTKVTMCKVLSSISISLLSTQSAKTFNFELLKERERHLSKLQMNVLCTDCAKVKSNCILIIIYFNWNCNIIKLPNIIFRNSPTLWTSLPYAVIGKENERISFVLLPTNTTLIGITLNCHL